MSSACRKIRRIGVVGYGHLGQFLVQSILETKCLELGFVWNRTYETLLGKVDEKYILRDLEKFTDIEVDLIVEVAHPCITEIYGERFLEHADYMIGSPTILANLEVEKKLFSKACSNSHAHGLYVPSGAFWGAEDVRKMADRGTLKGLKVTMKKAPSSLQLCGELKTANEQITNKATVLYTGSVRGLCPLAPNNVNTMAVAAIAAHNLGFDGVQGCLVSDPSLDCHIMEIELFGPGGENNRFQVKTVRTNPCKTGAVTGNFTSQSFLSSLLASHSKGNGIHLS